MEVGKDQNHGGCPGNSTVQGEGTNTLAALETLVDGKIADQWVVDRIPYDAKR